MQIALVILVGLPAAGKTSFAKKIAETRGKTCLHICHDEIINPVDVLNGVWKQERQKIVMLVHDLLLSVFNNDVSVCPSQLKTTFSNFAVALTPCIIIVDDNNYYRSMRYDYYQLAKKFNCGFCQVYFDITLAMALDNNSERPNSVPANIIVNMSKKIESPDVTNVWEKYVLKINALDGDSEEHFYELISKCINDPPKLMTKATNSEHSLNIYHSCDLALRKIITHKLHSQNCDSSTIKNLSIKLSKQKAALLKDIKQGLIAVPSNESALEEFFSQLIVV